MPEASGLLRQWNLLSGLSTRAAGATVQELALEHGANLKAIRRDLVTLRNAGFPLEEERGDFGRKRWRIAPATALVPMSFTWDEAIALCLARRFLEPLTGTTFWVAAARGFAKIRAVLSPHAVAYLDKMASAIHVTTRGTADKYAAKAEICDLLTEAIEGRQMVDLTYQSENATEAASRTVYPLGFVFHGGSLYLIAHASDHDEQRTYKVDRVEAVHLLKLKFQRPPEFGLSTFLTGAFGVYRGDGKKEMTARVRFLPSVARAIREKQYHASQQLSPEPDGSVIAEFRLTSVVELKSWLLSWGANVLVLEPASLAEEMRREAEKVMALYERKSPAARTTREPRHPSTKRSKPRRPR